MEAADPSGSAHLTISVERLPNPAHAIYGLAEIWFETAGKPQKVAEDGWPGLNWGYADQPKSSQHLKSAFAVDCNLIQFSSTIDAETGGTMPAQVSAVVRGFLPQAASQIGARSQASSAEAIRHLDSEIASLRHLVAPGAWLPGPSLGIGPAPLSAGDQIHVHSGQGELEVAVSNDNAGIVVGTNGGVYVSRDRGKTFSKAGIEPCGDVEDNVKTTCLDDPSVGIGASGRFYYSWMLIQHGPRIAFATLNESTGIFHRITSITCPGADPNPCYSTDQPHMAVDRWNRSSSGEDQLYVAWRNIVKKGTPPTPMLNCSADGGHTWLSNPVSLFDGSADFPRLAVARDGSVFTVFVSGEDIELSKYSSCAAGLTKQDGFPVKVASFQTVACPLPGQDRCNIVNLLNSPMVATDSQDGNHIYLAWATSTETGKNENVVATDSIDGGRSFRAQVQVNRSVPGRRFLPWIAAGHNTAYVGWYDRRDAVKPADNDVTGYYGATLVSGDTRLRLVEENRISKENDRQCANIWPVPPSNALDSTTCSSQPQMAGVCYDPNETDLNKLERCDFKIGCLGNRVCKIDSGLPKFGDYNGLAVWNGLRYSVWSSAVAPPGVPDSGDPRDKNRLHIYLVIDKVQ